MRYRILLAGTLSALMSFVASAAFAEDVAVHLKTGEVLTGTLVEEAPGHVTVDFGKGAPTRFARTRVRKLERDVGAQPKSAAAANQKTEAPGAPAHSDQTSAGPIDPAIRAAAVQALMAERADWVDRNTGLAAPLTFTIIGGAALVAAVALQVAYADSNTSEYNGSSWDDYSDEGLKTASIVTGIGAAALLGTGAVLWLLRTSPARQEQQLQRIDEQLRLFGFSASLTPWGTPETSASNSATGGLRLKLRF